MFEAFVYQWSNSKNKRYIGFHKGAWDDGYICSSSSDLFWNDWNDVSISWVRDILAIGTVEEMRELEYQLLLNLKEEILAGITIYNMAIRRAPLATPEVKDKIRTARRANNSYNTGKKFSDETRERMSISQKERLKRNPALRPKTVYNLTCSGCKQEFERKYKCTTELVYCSRECRGRFKTHIANPDGYNKHKKALPFVGV